MEFKNLTGKEKIPALGLGTWNLFSVEAISYALRKGITHIDTAEFYGTETYVGEAIAGADRKKLFITTKVSPHHLFTEKQIFDSCRNSLKKLGTNYVDLYLIHWPNPVVSLKNVMRVFDKLIKEGLIRHAGVSNFSVNQFENAQKYTQNKIVTNQVHYNLLHRNPEKELLNYCEKNSVILTAYTPLASGQLKTSSFPALDKVAQKYSKTAAQVALRWLIEKPQVITIPKASSAEHIDEILGSLGWQLEKEDQELLNKAFV
jgi:diketogulonate reductase-like aldo/keto reductase